LVALSTTAQTPQPDQASAIAAIYANSSDTLFRLIGAYMAPDDAPPMPGKG
jgi:hypothetical protein